MTHILVNPGYPLHYRRSRTVDADLLSRRNRQQLAPAEFDRIRSESRQAWLDNWEDAGKACVNRQTSTTYSRLHNHKILDRQTKSRPTSPTRRNNPHPTKVFLHLRVHKDKSNPSSHLESGQNPHADAYYQANHAPLPQGTMYYTLKDIKRLEKNGQTEMLRKIMNFHPEQPNETWLNTPTRDGRMFNNLSRSRSENTMSEVVENSFKPRLVPSLHRWLKQAGKEEEETTMKLWRSQHSDSTKNATSNLSKFGKLDPNRYLLQRYETTPRVTIHRPYRTDFVIHPEFTTT